MRPRVCVCCGELMSERGGALSRNPNICASCSSLLDGIDENDDKAPPEAITELQRQVQAPGLNREEQPVRRPALGNVPAKRVG